MTLHPVSPDLESSFISYFEVKADISKVMQSWILTTAGGVFVFIGTVPTVSNLFTISHHQQSF